MVSDARTRDGRLSRAFQESVIAQWGPLPDVARSLLREAARLNLELLHAGSELDVAHQGRRRRDVARLRRMMTPMRGQLDRLLQRIEELAKHSGSAADLGRRLRAIGNHD